MFVVENQKRIEEYYGKGGFDTIENKYSINDYTNKISTS